MGKCKAKAIHIDLGTFRHNKAYPEIIHAYSHIFKTLCNPGIFRTVIYPEPWIFRTRSIFRTLAYVELWYIQNPLIFRTLAFSNSEAYSEPCQTSTMKHFAKIVNGYNYFCSNGFPRSLLHETNIMKKLLQT